MSATEMTLDTLCAALLASYVRANQLLAAMPLAPSQPAQQMQTSGPDWSDSGAGPIPWQQFYTQPRLALASAELTLVCHVRRKPMPGPVLFSTRKPAWWQRLLRRYAALQLKLTVIDGVCTPRLLAISGVPPRRPQRLARLLQWLRRLTGTVTK